MFKYQLNKCYFCHLEELNELLSERGRESESAHTCGRAHFRGAAGGRTPSPLLAVMVRSDLDAFGSLTGEQSSSVPSKAPRSFPLVPPLHTASRSLQPLRPDEADSGRADEDEQDMPDGFCHLFGILYFGHLLFSKYVPTR